MKNHFAKAPKIETEIVVIHASKNDKKVEAVQVISAQKIRFGNPLRDVYTAEQPIAGCAWIETDEGLVLIDTMLGKHAAAEVLKKVRETGKKIKYIIYTHHHIDHVSGCGTFLEDHPEATIIASEFLPANLDRYKAQAEHRSRISAQQFNIPELPTTAVRKNMRNLVYPTETFVGAKTIELGNKTFELHTARGETDDVCWVWVPEIRTAFIGDLMIGSFPNIGNPWKATRYTLDWAKTLEKVRSKKPEHLFYNGAGRHLSGQAALDGIDHNIEVIVNLHDQVIDCINRDMHISEMIHAVKIPVHLQDSPYLASAYSRPEFFVYNTYRWYHGYFDHNPAHLIPRPEKEVNAALMEVVGTAEKIIAKAKALLKKGQAQLGLQVLDVLIQTQPENVDALNLRIELLEKLGSEDTCLMSKNTWIYFIEKDKALLQGVK